MKTSFMLFVIVSGLLSGTMYAATRTIDRTATVVSVESRERPSDSNYAGANPSDFPLQPAVYHYDVVARMGSTIYRTSYESAVDHLPAVVAANHSIQVDLRKGLMYVTIPDEGEVRLAVESRSKVQDVLRMDEN